MAPLLNAAAALPQDDGGWPAHLFGLSQQAKIAQSNRLVYQHTLQRVLLPRLMLRLEQQMHGRFDDPEFLYEATRVYLMLGNAGPLDPALVRDWMTADWQVRYPGALNARLRADLLTHLNALLATPLPTIALDGALVEAARATFSRVSLAERVYSRIRGQAERAAVPDWVPADALGQSGAQLFTRISRTPLTEGIPGFFTAAGYHDVLLRDLARPRARWRARAGCSAMPSKSRPTGRRSRAWRKRSRDSISLKRRNVGTHCSAIWRSRGSATGRRQCRNSMSCRRRSRRCAICWLRSCRHCGSMPGVPGGRTAPTQGKVAALLGASPAEAAPARSPALQAFEAHYQPLIALVGNGSRRRSTMCCI